MYYMSCSYCYFSSIFRVAIKTTRLWCLCPFNSKVNYFFYCFRFFWFWHCRIQMIEEVERYINILNSSKNTNKINYLLVYYYLFKVFKWLLRSEERRVGKE